MVFTLGHKSQFFASSLACRCARFALKTYLHTIAHPLFPSTVTTMIIIPHYLHPQSHDPLRGMYDAVFRPDRPPSPPAKAPGPPLLLGDTEEEPKKQPDGVTADAVDEAENDGGAGAGAGDVTPFLPDERLTLEEAVWMYTAGGAVAAGAEERLGAIRPGFLADLTVVEVQGGGERLLENPRSGNSGVKYL